MTAVEYLFETLWDCPKDKLTWYTILEKAKEMEKQQIIDAYCASRLQEEFTLSQKLLDEYYNDTYGSKGSDETKVVEFDHLKKEITSSQTEISDEEIEAIAMDRCGGMSYESIDERADIIWGAKWYREQLNKK